MSSVKALLRAALGWPPLNRLATVRLRAVLPRRLHRYPALARFLRPVGVVEAALPNGRTIRLQSQGDDDIAGALFWRGWDGHEPETARIFFELSARATVTLDVGAHVGYFALLAAHANPGGRVYAFEPMPRVRERLKRNAALNGADRVVCVPFAAGRDSGRLELFHGRDSVPSSSSLSRGFMQSVVSRRHLTSTLVDVVRIDDFLARLDDGRVDLVKLDTETTEPDVLRGMAQTMDRDHPDVICEVLTPEVGAEIERLLARFGYECFLLTAGGPRRTEHVIPDPACRNYLFHIPQAG